MSVTLNSNVHENGTTLIWVCSDPGACIHNPSGVSSLHQTSIISGQFEFVFDYNTPEENRITKIAEESIELPINTPYIVKCISEGGGEINCEYDHESEGEIAHLISEEPIILRHPEI